jgi:membrane protein implicated in regulation of membrane protease activity
MTLGLKLFMVFLAFLSVLAAVIWMAFRERRLARLLPQNDLKAQQAADGRVMATIFGAILGGMLLTFLVAWLVFF